MVYLTGHFLSFLKPGGGLGKESCVIQEVDIWDRPVESTAESRYSPAGMIKIFTQQSGSQKLETQCSRGV